MYWMQRSGIRMTEAEVRTESASGFATVSKSMLADGMEWQGWMCKGRERLTLGVGRQGRGTLGEGSLASLDGRRKQDLFRRQ
jgi:hypothetical protein